MRELKKTNLLIEGYEEILNDVRSLLEKTKYQAYKIVDNLRVQTYWQIGERIARGELEHKERADYGKRIIERLSTDLGFHKRDIYRMLQFYKVYPIVTSLKSQLSWTHYYILITIENKEARSFYEHQIIQNNWSVREFKEAIKTDLFQRLFQENKHTTNSFVLAQITPNEIIKSSYNFNFVELPNGYSERQLEDALMNQVEKLLLEFGNDFFLGGRQRKIIIDQQIHSVDIEFYHRGIPCIVLVDLKIGSFKSEYVGQMNKYLNYYKENKTYQGEKPPIGLIICENKGEEEVHYALGGLQNKIFVAEYKTKLPSEIEIKAGLQKAKSLNVSNDPC